MSQSYAQTEFENSSVFFWHVNNALCVCLYLYYFIFDKLRRAWSHWNTAWHPTQSLIKISGAHLWLTNHTPHLWSTCVLQLENLLFTWNHTNHHEQQSSMLERSPIVRKLTYHALRSQNFVFCKRLYEPAFILKRKYIKWNAISLCVTYRDFTGEFTFSEKLNAHTETNELRSILSHDFYVFHLANFKHTQSLKLRCAPTARASHIVNQNSLHFTISEALIAHTEAKELRMILSRGSLHTPSLNLCCTLIAYEYHILWIFTFI